MLMTIQVRPPRPVALAGGRVVTRGASSTKSDGDGGGGNLDEGAEATTTPASFAVTITLVTVPTTLHRAPSPSSIPLAILINNGHVKTDDGSNSSLLRTATDGISLNYSGGRRSRLSGLPLGAHRIADYSPLPPTAVESGAARRSGDRPTVIAEVLSATASPRPGPASLLPSSGRPQQVRL